jgi:hypothetical protein
VSFNGGQIFLRELPRARWLLRDRYRREVKQVKPLKASKLAASGRAGVIEAALGGWYLCHEGGAAKVQVIWL